MPATSNSNCLEEEESCVYHGGTMIATVLQSSVFVRNAASPIE